MLETQFDSLKNNFLKHLTSIGLSPKSHKNYRSDLSHFSGWLILKIRSFGSYIETLSEAVPFLSKSLANDYKNYMLENKIPAGTLNRRLSTLRHLSAFLAQSQAVDFDFMEGIENFSKKKNATPNYYTIADKFRGHLEASKASPSTIKNYVSDVRQFLAWLEANQQTANSKF